MRQSQKPTPGPWEYGGQIGKRRAFIFAGKTPAGEDRYQIGVVNQSRGESGGDPEANGHLIAASPDLLAVCKRFVLNAECTCHDGGEGFRCDVCEGRAAIAKAGAAP